MKKYVLTDFNRDRWSRIVPKNVQSALEKRIEKGNIYGELGHNNGFNENGEFDRSRMVVQLNNATHEIIDIKYHGGLIEGEVHFLSTEKGKLAQDLIEKGLCEFGIRGLTYEFTENGVNSEHIVEIITWDVIPKIK